MAGIVERTPLTSSEPSPEPVILILTEYCHRVAA